MEKGEAKEKPAELILDTDWFSVWMVEPVGHVLVIKSDEGDHECEFCGAECIGPYRYKIVYSLQVDGVQVDLTLDYRDEESRDRDYQKTTPESVSKRVTELHKTFFQRA